MSNIALGIPEIDNRIAIVTENLRELIEQAAASTGAADEDLMSRGIADQEEERGVLKAQRNQITGGRH
jgi:hypothetical protein